MPRMFVSALLVCLATLAWADPPPGTKRVDPFVRFHFIQRHSSHLFFLAYETGDDERFLAQRSVQVKNDAAFPLENVGRIIQGTRLLAIAAKDFEKLKKSTPPITSISEKTPGVLVAPFPPPGIRPPPFASARK